MKKSNLRVVGVLMTVAAILLGCSAGGQQAPGQPATIEAPAAVRLSSDQLPRTLAIFPFENNSVTDAQRLEPLSKGLAAMLITDLGRQPGPLKLIERDKIAALLKEIALGQSGVVDQATAIKAGRILGAQSIAFGSFMVLMDQVRIDLRIVHVETSELILADAITGKSDAILELAGRLAAKISRSLQVAYTPAAAVKGNIDAALLFSRGVDALDQGKDQGKKADARRLFEACIAMDPSYRNQIDAIGGLD
jgi:TolB-like protein